MKERDSGGENSAEKDQEASEERRRQYRDEGQIPNSHDLISALAFATMTIALYFIGADFTQRLYAMFRLSWANFSPRFIDENGYLAMTIIASRSLLPQLIGLSIALTLVPLMTGLILSRFSWTWKRLEFDLNKINPISGVQRMISPDGLINVAKQLLKTILFAIVIYFVIRSSITTATRNILIPPKSLGIQAADTIMKLLTAVAISFSIWGFAEWAFNWWRMEKQMMMSLQELKDETKQQEGDPIVKSARRRMARDFVMKRSVANVKKATFVVTNPEHYAVAIRYVKGMSAPIVVAKGQDFLALRIKEIAKKNEIAIVENKALARTLYKTVKLGQEIPNSLWASIVEVIKYIYHTKGRDYFDKFNLFQSAPAQS